MAGKLTAPALGLEDAEFGAFCFFFWGSFVGVYDYALQSGNAIQQQAEKDTKIYNLLVLQTANNERACEFLMDDKAQLHWQLRNSFGWNACISTSGESLYPKDHRGQGGGGQGALGCD